MNEFMKILLSLSVSGTLLFLLILGLKLLYKNKFSRRWQYYIWSIVALRFLVPFTPDTMNLGTLLETFRTPVITEESPAVRIIPVRENGNDSRTNQMQTQTGEKEIASTYTSAFAPSSFCVYDGLLLMWAAMALVLFVRRLTIYQGFIRYIKSGSIEVSDIKTLNLLSDCEEKLNIKTRVELYHNALIASPIMIGFFRPSIILPARELEHKELYYAFVHELFHYKRRDMFYKWLIQIVICIHWFNPFVYLLEKEVNKACELSCDENIISLLDDKARREYGDALIYFLKSDPVCRSSFTSVTMTEGAEQLKERLGAIMNFRKKSKAVCFFMGVLTLCIILAAAFSGIYPISAANSADFPETGSLLASGEQNRKTATYHCDGDMDSDLNFDFSRGWDCKDWDEEEWNWDEEDWNWDEEDWGWDEENWNWNEEDWGWDEENWNWNEEDWGWDEEDWNWNEEDWGWDEEDWNWDLDDEALEKAYAAFGLIKDGDWYSYQGELVNIILDQRPDSSFYRLNTNAKGTVSVKVIRNEEGEIEDVSYMTEEEVAELLPKLLSGADEIPLINTEKWDGSGILTIEAYYETDLISVLPSMTDKIILREYLTEDNPDYYASTEIKDNVLVIHSGERPAANYKSYIEIYVPYALIDHVKTETVNGENKACRYNGVITFLR